MKNKIKSQVTVELTLCLSIIFILMLGITNIFYFFCSEQVHRNIVYDTTRNLAGSYVTDASEIPIIGDILNYFPLNIDLLPNGPAAEATILASDRARAGMLNYYLWKDW
jgi:hypothetical protein